MEPLLALANCFPNEMCGVQCKSAPGNYVWCGWVQLATHRPRPYIIHACHINVIDCFPNPRDKGRFKKWMPYQMPLRDPVDCRR